MATTTKVSTPQSVQTNMVHKLRDIGILVDKAISAARYDFRTHVIAQIVSYDPETNLAVVQPVNKAIRLTDAANPIYVQLGVIQDVPVLQRGSGKLWCTVAPAENSYGLLHISDRVIDDWLTLGGVVEPQDIRCHSLSDAIFEPSLLPTIVDGDNGQIEEPIKTDRISLRTRSGLTEVSVLDDESVAVNVNDGAATVTIDNAGNITIVSDGGSISLDNGTQSVSVGSTVDTGAASDFVAMATKVDTLWTTLYTLLTTWIPVPMDGGAAFKTAAIAAFPSPPSSVASGNLKAE